MRLRSFMALLLAAFTLAMTGLPAQAHSENGTHAWSTSTLVLRDGPGAAYDVTGEIATDLEIKVLRCQKLWCLVDGHTGRGWTSKDHIAFGKTPTDWPGGINPDYPLGGTACFFEGTNYTGASLCIATGRVIPDLALLHLDNRFSSVQLSGGSVAACRDRGFASYCERIIESQPVLHMYLRRNLSSIRAY
jgi:hypothetical protein